MTQRRFAFNLGGTELVGNLFLPDVGRPTGVVVTAGPLTSVKEQASGTYARAMAERGFAALAFDHRHLGESGGQPRQLIDPKRQVADIGAAVSALLAEPSLRGLPVFGLGVCFGAGPMMVAVQADSRFRGVAGVAGVYTDRDWMAAALGDAFDRQIARGRRAEAAWQETGVAETIPAVAPDGGDVAMPLREAYEFYGTTRGAVSNYVNGYAVQSFARQLPFDAMHVAGQLAVPVTVVHSKAALAPELAGAFLARLTTDKDDLWLSSQGQIDFYDDPELIDSAADFVVKRFDHTGT